MRRLYVILVALFAYTPLFSQTLDSTNAPNLGDTWNVLFFSEQLDGMGNLPSVDLPVEGSTGVAYDFSDLGNELVYSNATATFAELFLDSSVQVAILPLPLEEQLGMDETLPDFPEGTLFSDADIFKILFGDRSGLFFAGSFLQSDSDGVYQIGSAEVDGGQVFDATIDSVNRLVVLPFGLELGDTLRSETSDTSFADGEMSTTRLMRRFEYVSNGSMVTPFNTYENVSVYRILEIDEFGSPDFTVTITQEYYAFYRPGSFQPIMRISFDVEEQEPVVGIGFYEPAFLVSTNDEDLVKQQFEAFPNPAKEEVTVRFENKTTNPVQINLLHVTGQVLRSQTYDGLVPGVSSVLFALPQGIAAGTYFLQLQQGGASTIQRLMVGQ